ncbi:MAG: adenylate/guanylate cyclase domain-containing protein [Candidatus Marinimicrobia bacterium]|nr:adenylate/guanylate cyclase domain-containing protein [Candidatus Neomarinimicrobiota bacterium]
MKIVCFTDISGFHEISKNTDIEIHKFLNAYYQQVGDVAISLSGEIIKYIGDSMLIIFPPSHPNTIVDKLTHLCHEFIVLLNKFGINNHHHLMVGLAMGEIKIGSIGHPSKIQKDVFGLTVNHAAMACKLPGISISPKSVVKFHD